MLTCPIKVAAMLAVCLSFVPPALADQCSDIVRDDAHVISDVGRVQAAAQSLGNMGMTVRVRVLDSSGSLDKVVLGLRDQCPDWRAGSNAWKSTMFLLAFEPRDHNQVGAYFGVSNATRFGAGKWQDVLRDRLVPKIKAFEQGEKDAITTGLVNSLEEFQAVYAKPSTGGTTTIVHSTNYSRVFMWFFILVAIGGVIAIAYFVMVRRSNLQAAQAEARRVRANCVRTILEITDDAENTLLKTKVDANPLLQPKFERYLAYGNRALVAFNSFDSLSGDDPNAGKLSVDAYNWNKKSYQEIIESYVLPAIRVADDIRKGRATDPEPSPFVPQQPPRQSWAERRRQQQQYAPPPATPTQQTTIINQGNDSGSFLTGVIVGEALSDRSGPPRYREDPPPSYTPRERDTGGSFPVNTGSQDRDSGGSFDVDISSTPDSGGSISSC